MPISRVCDNRGNRRYTVAPMTTHSLDPLIVFQAVAETRSFTLAARKLGLDKARVSRVVAALEASVDAPLFIRTTRVVRPTEEGLGLAARIGPHLAALQDAISAVPDRSSIPSGEVSLASTPDLARFTMGPILARFRERFPAVRVQVLVSEAIVDLDAQGIDLAVRVGKRGSLSQVARKLGDLRAGFFASPTYLARRGTPSCLEELAEHDGLWPPPRRSGEPFSIDTAQPPPPAAISCTDFATVRALACVGAGVALLPTFMIRSDVAAGTLVQVLRGTAMTEAPVWLISRSGVRTTPRVNALRTVLLAELPAALASAQ